MTLAPPPVAVERFTLDGSELRVMTSGDGPPVLYLHGAGDPGVWIPFLASLATTHHVVRPDLPGFTESTATEDVATPRDIAKVMASLLARLDLTDIVVLGSSLGGWVGAELAILEPARIAGLVLAGPAGLRLPGGPANPADGRTPRELVEATWATSERRELLLEAMEDPNPNPALVEQRQRNAARTNALLREESYDEDRFTRELGSLGIPTIVVWGELDGLLPAQLADYWTAAIPNAVSVIIPGAGHVPHQEATDEFLAVAAPYLGA